MRSPLRYPRPGGAAAGRRPRPRPLVRATSAISALSGWLYIATGFLVIVSTFTGSGTPGRDLALIRTANGIAVGAGVLMLLLRRRSLPWIPHVVISGGVLLITAALSGSGGGVSAVAYAAVYCLAPGYAFLILPPRAATAQMVATMLIGAPVLALQPGVGVAEQIVVWSVTGLLAAVIGWMARALRAAETDVLTGLVSRRGVERALQEAIASADRADLSLALVDLDHFKAYNDDRGRAAGDRLLQLAAQTWAPLVPDGATFGRFSADEFAVLLPGSTAAQAVALVDRLHEAIGGAVTCSAGVSQHGPGESASMQVARTEAAVYNAKREGRARTHVHAGSALDGSELRAALARGEFVVHFQPIVELSTRRTIAAEALVRWQHPERGMVSPLDFIPEAEQSGMIIDLGAWILQVACHEAASWVPVDGVLPYVTVNASGNELLDPTYAATVEAALHASGLAPQRLVLELVESHYDIESAELAANLHRLRTLGVRTAMDDFGVGYSSLDRLRRAGVDILKIDRSFVTDIDDSGQEAPLVAAIIAMAHALGLRVVAEGVETETQARWLLEHRCDSVQGWLLGRPRPRLQGERAPSAAPAPAST